MVNVLWGALNAAIAYVLISRVGEFHLHQTKSVLAVGVGALVMALHLASWFGKVYSGK